MIGKPAQQRGLIPTWMLPELLACQSLHHAPLWCRGKWVVGVGPLITSSRDHRPPRGMCRATLFSSMEKKILFAIFFPPWLDNSIPPLGGEHAHHLSAAEKATMCLPLQVKQKGLYSAHLYTPKRLYLSFWFFFYFVALKYQCLFYAIKDTISKCCFMSQLTDKINKKKQET